MNRLSTTPSHRALGHGALGLLGRMLHRFQRLAYSAVALGAMASAGLQPPHTAAVEVATVMVATGTGAELPWRFSPSAPAR